MPVYNGATTIAATVESILAQTFPDFELIVVDDGSTDTTPKILEAYAATDRRVRTIRQPNAGITRALIQGCAAANTSLIARHDCGDRSHPDRLRRQVNLFEQDPSVVLVSSATRYSTSRGEWLYTVAARGSEVRRSLLQDDIDRIRGLTHHGSAMFRRDSYLQVRGYRSQFYFAQDLDLWIRLAAVGEIEILAEELYDATVDVHAISSRNRNAQVESARLAIAIRNEGTRREVLLEAASRIRPASSQGRRLVEAKALYFIASCLRRNKNRVWRAYLWQAFRRMITLR